LESPFEWTLLCEPANVCGVKPVSRIRVCALLSLLATVSGISACCERTKCGTPQTEITILDEKGERFTGEVSIAEVDSFSFCDKGCTLRVNSERVLTIQAGDYPAQRLTFEPKTDECGNSIAQHATLHLSKDSGNPGRVEQSDGSSCGGD
jgi:hypothetical protein